MRRLLHLHLSARHSHVVRAVPPPQLDRAAAMETGATMEHVRVAPFVAYRSGEAARVATPLEWRIYFDPAERATFIDPLMGWTGSLDPQQGRQMDLSFHSAEEACDFAARQGWVVDEVEDPPDIPIRNVATIPGGGGRRRPFIPYEANFSVKRGGVPKPVALQAGEKPPY